MNKNMDISAIAGEMIRKRMLELVESGMSYRQLAKKADCSDTILRFWRDGKRLPRDINTIDRIMKAFGISFMIGSVTHDCRNSNSDAE